LTKPCPSCGVPGTTVNNLLQENKLPQAIKLLNNIKTELQGLPSQGIELYDNPSTKTKANNLISNFQGVLKSQLPATSYDLGTIPLEGSQIGTTTTSTNNTTIIPQSGIKNATTTTSTNNTNIIPQEGCQIGKDCKNESY